MYRRPEEQSSQQNQVEEEADSFEEEVEPEGQDDDLDIPAFLRQNR